MQLIRHWYGTIVKNEFLFRAKSDPKITTSVPFCGQLYGTIMMAILFAATKASRRIKLHSLIDHVETCHLNTSHDFCFVQD